MLTFTKWVLLEFPVSDIRYFEALPDTIPPPGVTTAQVQFGLEGKIRWKLLANKAFTHSRELDDGIIAMRVDDETENWFHELGHEVFDHADHSEIIPILDQIKKKYGYRDGGYKWITLGGWGYTYSHSGKEYEYDELFAITFAFVVGGIGDIDDPDLQAEFNGILDKLGTPDKTN